MDGVADFLLSVVPTHGFFVYMAVMSKKLGVKYNVFEKFLKGII